MASASSTSAGRPVPATKDTATSGNAAAVTITGEWKALVSDPGVASWGLTSQVSGSPRPASTVTATTPQPTAAACRKAKAAARFDADEPS